MTEEFDEGTVRNLLEADYLITCLRGRRTQEGPQDTAEEVRLSLASSTPFILELNCFSGRKLERIH